VKRQKIKIIVNLRNKDVHAQEKCGSVFFMHSSVQRKAAEKKKRSESA